jgi:DNA-binding response OmpR family regulator
VFNERTRILVVDDDPILREFASVYLTAPLCHVETVPDAAAALDLLSREAFDIVLVDIEMPGMNGYELVRRMRAEEKLRTIPIVMITCREDIVSIDQAYTAGATSFTAKPINWRQLSYQLRYVIRASKREDGVSRPGGEDGMTANAVKPSTMDREIASSLRAIINTASRMVGDRAEDRAAADAREITTVAECALRKLLGTAEVSEGTKSFDRVDQPRVA